LRNTPLNPNTLSAGREQNFQLAFQAAMRLEREGRWRDAEARFSVGDPRLDALEALAEDADTLGEDDRIALEFARAKAFSDLDERSRSFHHPREGNARKHRQIVHDQRPRWPMVPRHSCRQAFAVTGPNRE
jgi:hypothetical protein